MILSILIQYEYLYGFKVSNGAIGLMSSRVFASGPGGRVQS